VASQTLTWIRRLSFVLVLAVNGAQTCARPELVALNR
jgi:hypothetical protein